MKKLSMDNKKHNLVLTCVLLAVVLVVAIVLGFYFESFRTFQTWFYTELVDETQQFSVYSSSIEGTTGDSEIYIMYGTENTVALVRAEDAETYSEADAIVSSGAAVTGVAGSDQLEAAQETLEGVDIAEAETADDAVAALQDGTADVAILRYADAEAAAEADGELVISDAEVEKVPKVLVIGGTHPNEPAGQLAATIFLENAQVERGVLYVITELNKSAYSHSMPQEATTWYYTLTTKSGATRTFKYGARATNTVDQWPSPDVYTHSSGQSLSATESRNINRSYPGSATGTYTERVAYAVTQLIVQNDITVVVDLHEAAPEYVTINAMVAHQDAIDLAAYAGNWIMADYEATTADGEEIDGVKITVEESPTSLHGLTHRELGDYTNAYAFLCETSNASQGKLRGAFTEDLITYETTDKFYEYAATLDGLLYARPVPIRERVARHVLAVESIIDSFNVSCMTRDTVSESSTNFLDEDQKQEGVYVGKFVMSGIPEYVDFIDNGVGYYLADET